MGRGGESQLTALVDTNVVVRHLTGDPPAQAARATAALRDADELLLPDPVFAECIYVLGLFYEVPRRPLARLMRAVLALPAITVLDDLLLLRALAVYERTNLHFVDAYLIAVAELSGVTTIVSFDRALDRVASIRRMSP